MWAPAQPEGGLADPAKDRIRSAGAKCAQGKRPLVQESLGDVPREGIASYKGGEVRTSCSATRAVLACAVL